VGKFIGRCWGVVGEVGCFAMGVDGSDGRLSDRPGPDSVRRIPSKGSFMRS
jgi:hypothetical protein